jgi:hypothetical protein
MALVLALAVLSAPVISRSDELVLKNGERLIGRLKTMEKGTITFASDMLGELKIPLHSVRRLVAGAAMLVAGGEEVQALSFEADNATATLQVAEEPYVQPVPLASITAINPPVRPKIAVSGNITAGFTDTHGSTSSLKSNLDAGLTIRTVRQRLRLQALYIYGREDNPNRRQPGARDTIETDKNFSASAKYDFFFSKRIYAYLSSSYKKDPLADLEYRLISSSGLGYQWIERPALSISTDAGVAWFKEKYYSRTRNPLFGVEDDQPRFFRNIARQDDAAWQAGMNAEWRLNTRLALLASAQYTESLDDREDYFLKADGELRLFLTRAFFSSLKALFEYDNSPGPDSVSTETKYILGLGWSF